MKKKLYILMAVAMLSMFAMTACSNTSGTGNKTTVTPAPTTGTTLVPTTTAPTTAPTTMPTTVPTTQPTKTP